MDNMKHDTAVTFKTGDAVLNFGQPAVVVEVRQDGLLVLRKSARAKSGWTADPAKCTKVGA